MKNNRRPEKNIAERVRAFAQPEVEALGFELWDITFEKVGTQYSLIIYIDEALSIEADGKILCFDTANVAAVRLVYTGGF